MSMQLQPSNLGEILDRTANLYRSRFLVFLGIAAIPTATVLFFAAAAFLLSAWIGSSVDSGTRMVLGVGIVVIVVVAIPVCLGATALGSAALTHAASRHFMEQPITIRGSYRFAWNRGWRYVGLLALQILFLAVIPFGAWTLLVGTLAFIAAFGLKAGVSGAGSVLPGAFMLLFGLVLVLFFLWMLVKLCLAFPACVVEQMGAWASLKRANTLSLGTRARMLVLYLLAGAVSWIVSLVLSVPAMVLLSLFPQLNTPQHAQTIGAVFLFLMYGSSFASQAFTKPVTSIALVVFYYDQRIRKEAFDIEWMMQQAGMIPAPSPAVEPMPWTSAIAEVRPALPAVAPEYVARQNAEDGSL